MKRPTIWLSMLLVAATALSYAPAYPGAFLWDDDVHVWQNQTLRSVEGLGRIWFEIGATPQYYPLTHTTFWIEYPMWGEWTVGYHITNVCLHALASLLVVALMKRLGVGGTAGAWVGGFIFALHPVHVESVAWISERKNVLSMVFLLASLWVYLRDTGDSVGARIGSWRWWGALGLFACAVLSKTVTGVMPAIVLVVAWWRFGRITRQDVARLAPLFAIAMVAALVTSSMERQVVGAEGADWSLGILDRVVLAGRAVWWYAGKLAMPAGLAFSYERWQVDASDLLQWAWPVGAAALVIVLWHKRHRWGRGPLAAALVFGGTLFPALGFVNLYPHRYSFVADHFQYHADVALIALVAAGAARWWRWSVPVIGALGVMTFLQARIYADAETLWRDTVARTPTSWLAHMNLAMQLAQGEASPERLAEAQRHAKSALALRPQLHSAHWLIGSIHRRLGEPRLAQASYERAIAGFREDIQRYPDDIDAYYFLWRVLDDMGRPDEAMDAIRKASDAIPDELILARTAAISLINQRRFVEATPYLERWVRLDPRSVEPRVNLALAYAHAGREADARRALAGAERLDPSGPAVADGRWRLEQVLRGPSTTSTQPVGRP